MSDTMTDENVQQDRSYTAADIKVLKGLEAVKKRPGMYIGDTDDGSGLHHMIYEVVDNGIDEHLAGHGAKLTVTIDADGGITVIDAGRGMPVDLNKEENRPAIELILCELHAGGKFDQNSYKVSGGLHGVGVSVVNALSSRLEATVWRDGNEYFIALEDGFVVEPLRTTKTGGVVGTGTKIHFIPSPKIFSQTRFDAPTIERRLRELSFLNSGLVIEFQDKRGRDEPVIMHAKGGLAEYVKYLDRNREPLIKEPIYAVGTRNVETPDGIKEITVEVALQWNDGHQEHVAAFTNNIPQRDGGQHVGGFRSALTRLLPAYAAANLTSGKSKGPALTGDDIREGMTAVVSIKMPDPKFSSQTKDKLVSSEASGPVQMVIAEAITTWLEENPKEAKSIIMKAIEASQAREAARKAREQVRKKDGQQISNLPGKLADCREKDPTKSEIFIVEGDSAGGTAKQGRSREFQAILPLRGKILNIERKRLDEILKSDQIGTLVTALGAGIGTDEYNPEKVRYHKIVIMTDADVDGEHIKTLLLTFFYRHMPDLIRSGYIYVAQPPLFGLDRKGVKNKLYFLNQDLLDRYYIDYGIRDVVYRKHDGTELSGPALADYVGTAKSDVELIRELDQNFSNVGMSAMLAISGALNGMVFQEEARKTGASAYVADRLSKSAKKGIRWTGRATEDGFELTRRDKGALSTYSITEEIARSSVATDLVARFKRLNAEYGAVGTLVSRKGEEIIVASPLDLFDTIVGWGQEGCDVVRYKGLGEMSKEQLWETTLDPKARTLIQVKISDDLDADDATTVLMGKDVPERKSWITTNALKADDTI